MARQQSRCRSAPSAIPHVAPRSTRPTAIYASNCEKCHGGERTRADAVHLGNARFLEGGTCTPDSLFVSVEQVSRALEAKRRMVIIDARPPSDWMRVRIPGAVSIPYHDLKRLDEVPNDGTWWLPLESIRRSSRCRC